MGKINIEVYPATDKELFHGTKGELSLYCYMDENKRCKNFFYTQDGSQAHNTEAKNGIVPITQEEAKIIMEQKNIYTEYKMFLDELC